MLDSAAVEPDSTQRALNKRVNYPFGMVLGVEEFQQEQEHFDWKHRLGNLLLHGSGTVCGLQVSAHPVADDVVIRISPGYAISPQGRWIWVQTEQCGRLDEWLRQHWRDLGSPPGLGPHTVYATLCYDQCPTDPVPIAARACAADEDTLAPSRLLETFKLQLVWQAPSQAAEEANRVLGHWLRRIELMDGPASPPGASDDRERLFALVRNLGLTTSPSLAPPLDGEPVRLWAATACDALRQALAIWITEVCPRLQTTTEDRLLLACIHFSTDGNGKLITGSVGVADCERPILVAGRLKQELFCPKPAVAKPVARIPYITNWLVLGPIFDPAHQSGNHFPNDLHPRAGEIVKDIDHHGDQFDPVALTQSWGEGPSHGDLIRYGGWGADGKTIFPERFYGWRKRSFAGLDWENISDIGDNVHTCLGGDGEDDPVDPRNYLNFAGKQHALGFFFVYILSPDRRETSLRIRHDDAARAWLNGEELKKPLVLPFLADHDIIDDSETDVALTLRRGVNKLLVALAETHKEWGFSARIADCRGLRFNTDNPATGTITPYESRYRHICVAGEANWWNAASLNRALFYVGGGVWKGRVRMAKEFFKIVARGSWHIDWWGPHGANLFLDNFHNDTPGLYEIIFNEDEPKNPVLILVKPFS